MWRGHELSFLFAAEVASWWLNPSPDRVPTITLFHFLRSDVGGMGGGGGAQWASTNPLFAPEAPPLKTSLVLPALYAFLPA